MDLASFFTWFWTTDASDYIQDRIDAEKPLSNYYILCQSRYISKHAASYQSFKKTLLRDAGLYLVEQWMHHLKREGISANVIVDALAAIRTPSPGRASVASSRRTVRRHAILTPWRH
jgi:hypothetical protein